jgi:hypothetical protein
MRNLNALSARLAKVALILKHRISERINFEEANEYT